MKCPKCGYHSFDHLDSCKKCGQGLVDHKIKFNLGGFFPPGQSSADAPEPVVAKGSKESEPSDDSSVDFGFDFLDEEEDPIEKSADGISLDDDSQTFSIDQPFSVDGETVPADAPKADAKGGKGPEFAF